jgi:hypothetical protein
MWYRDFGWFVLVLVLIVINVAYAVISRSVYQKHRRVAVLKAIINVLNACPCITHATLFELANQRFSRIYEQEPRIDSAEFAKLLADLMRAGVVVGLAPQGEGASAEPVSSLGQFKLTPKGYQLAYDIRSSRCKLNTLVPSS